MESFYSKNGFYLLLSLGVVTISGGLYFMLKSLTTGNNKVTSSANSSKQLPVPKDTKKIRVLTKDLGLEIFNKITFAYENHIEQSDTIQHKQTRMTFLDKPEDYARLCGAIVSQRNKDYVEIRDKILSDYGVSEQQYHDFLGQISMLECELSLFSNYQASLLAYPDANTVKDAFFYFAETMINAHELYSKQPSQIKNAYLLIEKLRTEDELYLRYGLTYFQIKYLIHYYNLLTDNKVKDYYYILPLLK
jgi:hypothetical protein